MIDMRSRGMQSVSLTKTRTCRSSAESSSESFARLPRFAGCAFCRGAALLPPPFATAFLDGDCFAAAGDAAGRAAVFAFFAATSPSLLSGACRLAPARSGASLASGGGGGGLGDGKDAMPHTESDSSLMGRSCVEAANLRWVCCRRSS